MGGVVVLLTVLGGFEVCFQRNIFIYSFFDCDFFALAGSVPVFVSSRPFPMKNRNRLLK